MHINPYRKCGACGGTGRMAITGKYAETLSLLRKLTVAGASVVANRDAHLFKCSGPALSNRLDRLEDLGLAKSHRFGRERRFFAK